MQRLGSHRTVYGMLSKLERLNGFPNYDSTNLEISEWQLSQLNNWASALVVVIEVGHSEIVGKKCIKCLEANNSSSTVVVADYKTTKKVKIKNANTFTLTTMTPHENWLLLISPIYNGSGENVNHIILAVK